MKPSELRALRESLGMTQEQFADAVGVRSNSIARLERGERAITPRMVAACEMVRRLMVEPESG